jgi:predicted ATP-grasp superfamily ATP-dependent carboligase
MVGSLEDLTNKVNEKLKNTPLFYITNDPERALGLENLLENFHIVCMDDSKFVDLLLADGKSIFSFEHEFKQLNQIFRNSVKLLEETSVRDFINSKAPGKKYFQTFKISSSFEKIAKDYQAEILNTSADLNMRFENKISQYNELVKAGVRFPETLVGSLKDFTYETLSKQLGPKFVVQFNRGHTGSGTHFIQSESEYTLLIQKFPARIARISKFVSGIPYTLNACIARNGIFIGGLNYQITGVEKIAQTKAATVGNDFSYREKIDQVVLDKIIEQVNLIGKTMANAGFKGLFGVDLIVSNGEIYIIEVNARQPASIPFYTKLQINAGQIPLSLLHLAEFLDIENRLDPVEYSKINLQPINAGQIFLRNIEMETVEIRNEMEMGFYNHSLDFINPAYSIDQIKENQFLLLTQKKGKVIKSGREIARMQVQEQIIDKNKNQPFEWIMKALLDVKSKLI